MAVFAIVAVRAIHDPEKLQRYRAHLDALLGRFGGRRIVTTDQIQVLEGEWRPVRLAIYEFASMEHLRAGYASPEYQPLIALRQEAIDSDIVVVAGL